MLNVGTTYARDSNGILITLDANEDGEIQISEALQVYSLQVFGTNASSLQGIEAFSNLRSFFCDDIGGVVSMDMTSLSNLESLHIRHATYLQHLNLAGLLNLEYVKFEYDGELTDLDFSSLTNLKELEFTYGTSLTDLNVVGLSNLEKLILPNSSAITSLDLSGLDHLKELDLGESGYLNNLNIASCINLEILNIDITSLSSLDLTAMESLGELRINTFGLSIPSISGNYLVLGQKPFLAKADISMFSGQELDMSGCTALARLRLNIYGTGDTSSNFFLNLRNGVTSYQPGSSFNFNNYGDSFAYICIDEGEQELFNAIIHPNSDDNIMLSTYCTFDPGGDYNTIGGNFNYDLNNNGCQTDNGFSGFAKVSMSGSATATVFSNATGAYKFFTQVAGNYVITPEFENDWFTVTPPNATINFPVLDDSTISQNFCIAANGVHPDVEIVVVPLLPAQPGFNLGYKLVYKNKGNQMLSGSLNFNYDGTVMDYISAVPAESSLSNSVLTFNYSGLMPFESRSVLVTLHLNAPMEFPAVNNGDVLNFSASITPATGDETPSDNAFILDQVVVGSYDPNDITCLEGNVVNASKIGDYLHYNINFENTGTAAATFIAVKNRIDETKFDINSLQLLYASHPVDVKVIGNTIEFYFGAINLVSEGKGNVVFKIKTLNTLQVNTEVMQQADIFFDYNWPIQTNEATTAFQVLSRGDFKTDNSVMVYPNPANNIVTISAATELKSVQLYDLQGRLLQSGTVNNVTTTIDLSSRTSGMYFVKITTEKGMKVEKVVKK